MRGPGLRLTCSLINMPQRVGGVRGFTSKQEVDRMANTTVGLLSAWG